MEALDSDTTKLPRSFRLNLDKILELRQLARNYRMSQTAILEELIHTLYLLRGTDFTTIQGGIWESQHKKRVQHKADVVPHYKQEGKVLTITIPLP